MSERPSLVESGPHYVLPAAVLYRVGTAQGISQSESIHMAPVSRVGQTAVT
jgi:hypothetical protein